MSREVFTVPRPEFYTAGGTLKPGAPSYVPRAADRELLEALQQQRFCYILTPRQMGKSSLMVSTAAQLAETGIGSVIIDLTGIGTTGISADAWYLGQLQRIVTQLHLRVDYAKWWTRHRHLSEVQRFTDFLTDVVLNESSQPVVIFVDEIDSTRSLQFGRDDYFAAIRALYNGRASNPGLERLTFVLLGVASPSDLVRDPLRTPFNIGTRIDLTDFTVAEAQPLAAGLAPDPSNAVQLLAQVLSWTGGHPYLTQKTCAHVAHWSKSNWSPAIVPGIVDELVKNMFLTEEAQRTDDNLRFIRDRVIEAPESGALLKLYRNIRRGEVVSDTELDPTKAMLKLSGLIKAKTGAVLIVRNRIYERVFDDAWIRDALHETETQRTVVPTIDYDVFVDYSASDKDWVEDFLLPRLEEAGVRVLGAQDFRVGVPLVIELERAIAQSRRTLVVLSPAWLVDRASEFENVLAQTLGIEETGYRLLPLLLEPTELPIRFSMLTSVDFTNKSRWDKNFERVLQALRSPLP